MFGNIPLAKIIRWPIDVHIVSHTETENLENLPPEIDEAIPPALATGEDQTELKGRSELMRPSQN